MLQEFCDYYGLEDDTVNQFLDEQEIFDSIDRDDILDFAIDVFPDLPWDRAVRAAMESMGFTVL